VTGGFGGRSGRICVRRAPVVVAALRGSRMALLSARSPLSRAQNGPAHAGLAGARSERPRSFADEGGRRGRRRWSGRISSARSVVTPVKRVLSHCVALPTTSARFAWHAALRSERSQAMSGCRSAHHDRRLSRSPRVEVVDGRTDRRGWSADGTLARRSSRCSARWWAVDGPARATGFCG